MICPYCRNSVVDGADFCPMCGYHLDKNLLNNQTNSSIINQVNNQDVYSSQINYDNTGLNNNASKKPNNKLVIAIVVVLILVIGGFLGAKNLLDRNQSNNSDKNSSVKTDDKTDSSGKNDTSSDNNVSNNNNGSKYDKNGAFLLAIEDTFTISGRGTVVTGKISRGTIHLGDEIQIIGLNQETINTTVTGIMLARQDVSSAEAGMNVGLVLKDVELDIFSTRGRVVARKNSIKAVKSFDADIHVLSKEESGSSNPILNDAQVQFYFRVTEITGTLTTSNVEEVINAGSDGKINVQLEKDVALEVGTEFSIRNFGRIIAKGTVTKIY